MTAISASDPGKPVFQNSAIQIPINHLFDTCPPMPPPMGCKLPRYFVFKSVCLMQLNGRRGRRVGTKKAVSSLKQLFINMFKRFEVVFHAPIIRRVLRLPLPVDGCCHGDRYQYVSGNETYPAANSVPTLHFGLTIKLGARAGT